MLIRSIDFETTGMPGPESIAAICEVGWCDILLVDNEVTIGDPQSVLCNPGHPIPPEVRAVHHISDTDLVGAMLPAEALAVVAGGPPDFFVAHNAPFEQFFFPNAPARWLCTYRIAVRLWPDAPGHSNQVLRYCQGLELPAALAMPPHRAAPDAYVTAHLLGKMIADGRASLDEMALWSSGPPLLPRITFGKHRGARWEDVPIDYLDWIVSKSDLDSDTKANARHHLKQRR